MSEEEIEGVADITEEVLSENNSKPKVKRKAASNDDVKYGTGLDVGTAFIVGSRQRGEKVEFRSIRNAYYGMAPNPVMQKLLTDASRKDDDEENKHGGTGYLEMNGEIIVIGEKALAYAASNHSNTRRPMTKGVLSPDDNAESIMSVLVSKALGEPSKKGEICRFSVPAEPFDDEDIDIIFHEGMMTAILEDLGYTAKAINEGEAICYSELSSEEDRLTGGAFSLGGGQSNGCIMFEGRPVISFSIARGGDWIDEKSFKHARMQSASEMTYFKENNAVDLINPKGTSEDDRAAAALAMYYRYHIRSLVEAVADLLSQEKVVPTFDRPIKWVVGGGTSKAINCVQLIKEEFARQKLPFAIGDVVQAENPMAAVSNGCLIAARLDEDNE
jgi:hypothetical protein